MFGFGLSSTLKIPDTLRVVADCWKTAEETLRGDVRLNHLGLDEEPITLMFHGKLVESFTAANQKNRIQQAFLSDLQNTFPDLRYGSKLSGLARGLIADVRLHKRAVEKKTGGDLGFVIARPQIKRNFEGFQIDVHRRGILCQAKIKQKNGKWGKFTPNQLKVLPTHLPYLALLLYRYNDKERRELDEFKWQLCNLAKSIAEVSDWLKCDHLISLLASDAIIQGVGGGSMGTSDKKILDEIVAPPTSPALIITIDWPKGEGPGAQVHVPLPEVAQTQVQLQYGY